MRPDEAGRKVREQVAPPWDDERASRVQERVFEQLAVPQARPRVASRRPWVALAAAAALAAAVSLVVWAPWTRSGQLEFVDGSHAVPVADAQVMPVLVSDSRIELRQLRGSVTYHVTERPERVFLVRAGAVTIEVLGTAFVVDRYEQKVEVRVERGTVGVSRGSHKVVLVEGERVVLDAGQVPEATDAEAALEPSAEPEEVLDPEALPLPEDTASGAPTAAGPEPTAAGPAASAPSAADLFRAADDARASGNNQKAIALLQDLIRRYPRDPRVTMATFTIGRLHMQSGRPSQAAQAFESCGSALGGEALAEAALARAAAGQSGQAQSLARRYLQQFPDGARAEQMRKLAGE